MTGEFVVTVFGYLIGGSMGRKLASVQYVHDVWPIEGADKIECVGVLG